MATRGPIDRSLSRLQIVASLKDAGENHSGMASAKRTIRAYATPAAFERISRSVLLAVN
jgi:hypothetical protein